MPKKILLFLAVLLLLLTGCQSARRIETAAVIENVCVQKSGGQLCYTFYRLTDSEKPDSVAVPASSFEEARRLAESSYIPHMTLAKLELLLIEQSVSREVMENDVAYIATQASFSPTAHVALCDEKTLQRLRRDTGAQKQIEQQIDQLSKIQPPEEEPEEQRQTIINRSQALLPILRDDSASDSEKNKILRTFVNKIVFYRHNESVFVEFYC